jgi:hypothetical protein
LSALYNRQPVSEKFLGDADEAYADLSSRVFSPEWANLSNGEVERRVKAAGFEVLRRLLQAHYSWRGLYEAATPVVGVDGHERAHVRRGAVRTVETVFGTVALARTAHSGRGLPALHPVDADLNLTPRKYSHELERTAVLAAVERSYDATTALVSRTTSAGVGKRTIEELVDRAAVDVDSFYADTGLSPESTADSGPLLVLSFDQKGVVLRSSDLRPETQRIAAQQERVLEAVKEKNTKGRWRGRKRMATVATVYTIQPDDRSADDIVRGLRRLKDAGNRPRRTVRPELKRLWASLRKEPEEVIEEAFVEARKRDPEGVKTWIVLVDGDPELRTWVKRAAARHNAKVTLVLDLIHALQYLWRAGECLAPDKGAPLEDWVLERLLRILNGDVSSVVGGLTRAATRRRLTKAQRKEVDLCRNYFLRRKEMMRYDQLLSIGAPIATGVIEGGCKHLISNRMDVSGAKWSIRGAEAILRLRAVYVSDDFQDFWRYHEGLDYQRYHATQYAGNTPAPTQLSAHGRPSLRIVK